MKNEFIFTAAAAIALLLTGCQKNEPVEMPEAVGNTTISAVIEGNLTRSNTDDNGTFTWSEGDKISVYTSSNAFKEFILSEGAGTNTASFTGELEEGETMTSYAVYPAGNHKLTDDALTVNLPKEYGDFDTEYAANTNSVMVAAVSEDGLSFKHVGGVLRFILNNVPVGAAQFEFTANLGITGDFAVTTGEGDVMTITAAAESEDNNVVTIKFKSLEEAADAMTFFVPLPLGEYKGISLAVKNESGEVVAEYDASTVSNELVRAELGLLPALDCATDMIDAVAELKKVFAAGGTYTLPKDIDITAEKLVVPADKEVTLDLNGHTVKAVNNANIKVFGDFTLKDGKGSGKIEATQDYGGNNTTSLIYISGENAKMTMQSGYIYAVRSDASNKGQFGVGLLDGADFTMKGGKIEAGWYAVSGNGTYKTQNTVINIEAGELISTADYAVYLPQSGTTNITGGLINGAAGGISIQRGILNISGNNTQIMSQNTGNTGDWSDGTGTLPNSALCVSGEYGDCTININGGNFSSKEEAVNILEQSSEHTITLNVTGGTFSDASVLPYVAADGAVTVKLDDDVTLASSMVVAQGSVTVDLNNHTLTAENSAVVEGTTHVGKSVAIYVADNAKLKAINGKIGNDTDAQFYGVFGRGDAEVTLENVVFGEMVTYAYNGAGAKLDADNCVFKGWLSGWHGGGEFTNCTFTIGKAYVPAAICYGSTVFDNCKFFKNGIDPDEDSYTGAPEEDGYIRCNYIVAACNPATTIDFNGCEFINESGEEIALAADNHPYHSCGHGDGTVADAQIKVDGTSITAQCSGAQKHAEGNK